MDRGRAHAIPWEDVMAKKTAKKQAKRARKLRSQLWFDNPDNPGMTALYLERYLNYGLTSAELRSGKPIIGIAQTGCDKTTPACLMAAATVNLPAIVLSGGPMLNGWWKGERCGSGMAVWKAREDMAAGRIDQDEVVEIAAASAPSAGHCNN